MKAVYLALGSNIGDRRVNLETAIGRLAAESPEIEVVRSSSIYETEPRDNPAQAWFLNMVVEARTALFPMQLLGRTQRIETEMGRRRSPTAAPKGPRIIDIDILLFGKFVMDTPKLTIPHPRIEERRFVLEPLAEIAPELRHPVLRRTMRELLAATAGQKVRRIP
jgi:2-amino-4-hydroxy-6-hydroxymethyldihydropteridine diphosphokinase